MRAAAAALAAAAGCAAQPGKVDPSAPCQDAPGAATGDCCYKDKTQPVMGGVDFVDLAARTQGVDGPRTGTSANTAKLNGYAFYFLSQANAAAFSADPWAYAPAWGGFCSWGVAGEAPDHAGQWTPSADAVDAYWIRYQNRTFMNKGYHPMQLLLADMSTYVPQGDKDWAGFFGSDKSQWPFNTVCCATDTYARMAACPAAGAPTPPAPAPPAPPTPPTPPSGPVSPQCGSPSAGPVLGGIDTVDLYNQYAAGAAAPVAAAGDAAYADTALGGYRFLFSSAANLQAFAANRTKYAPQLGGYCAWGLSGDDSHGGPNGGLWYSCTSSAACYDLIKFAPDTGLYFFLAAGPKNNFEADGTKYVPASQKNFAAIAGSGYCFNTDKVADAPPGPTPPGPTPPAPGPSGTVPAACVTAIKKTCAGLSGADCVACGTANVQALKTAGCDHPHYDFNMVCNA